LTQKVDLVAGELVGAELETPTSGRVRQDATTAPGDMTGIKLDEI
jgi:hypothetical protein